MRIFLLFIIFSITSFQIAKAEDLYMLNAPLAWGDHRDKEICKKIIDSGSINCDLVEVETKFQSNIFATYFRAVGTKGAIEKLVMADFSLFPLKADRKAFEDLIAGTIGKINVSSNGCAVVKVKAGCTCTDNGINGPKISCSGSAIENPWRIPDLGINVLELIPPLPANGSLIRLKSPIVKQQTISSPRVKQINACGVKLHDCTCMGSHFRCDDGSIRIIP